MSAIIAAALVLTVVVFVHELGHFLAARWAGVRVEVFSIGFGPVIFRLRRGATEYRLSALPFGGYVRLAGLRILDDPDDDTPERERFRSKSRLARLGIYLAGPAASVALGLVLLTASAASGLGLPAGDEPSSLRVESVTRASGAWHHGLRSGDVILGVATECFLDGRALGHRFASSAGQQVELLVRRSGVEHTLFVDVPDHGDLAEFGIMLTPLWLEDGESSPALSEPRIVSDGPGGQAPAPARARTSVHDAFVQSLAITRDVAEGTGRALSDAATGRADLGEFMGPVGIAWFSGRVTDRYGILSLLWVAGLLSLAVAFFNLAPVPPLDGGHVAILALEAIAGRELGPRMRLGLSLFGLALALLLLVVTTYGDIARLMH